MVILSTIGIVSAFSYYPDFGIASIMLAMILSALIGASFGMIHAESDLFAAYRCPECDGVLDFGRPAIEDEEAAGLRRSLEASRDLQREAEKQVADLSRRLIEMQQQLALICRQCGQSIPANAKFCGRCGTTADHDEGAKRANVGLRESGDGTL